MFRLLHDEPNRVGLHGGGCGLITPGQSTCLTTGCPGTQAQGRAVDPVRDRPLLDALKTAVQSFGGITQYHRTRPNHPARPAGTFTATGAPVSLTFDRTALPDFPFVPLAAVYAGLAGASPACAATDAGPMSDDEPPDLAGASDPEDDAVQPRYPGPALTRINGPRFHALSHIDDVLPLSGSLRDQLYNVADDPFPFQGRDGKPFRPGPVGDDPRPTPSHRLRRDPDDDAPAGACALPARSVGPTEPQVQAA
jgi:hypothetical protein